MQNTPPATKICSEAAVRTEKNKKQRQTEKCNKKILKNDILLPYWTAYFICCPRTCIRSLSLISLASRGWYSSKNSLGILLLALCSMCSYRIAAFQSFKEFVSQEQSSRMLICDGILSFSRGLHNQTVVVSKRAWCEANLFCLFNHDCPCSTAGTTSDAFLSFNPPTSNSDERRGEWMSIKEQQPAVCKQSLHLIPSDPKDSNIIQD